MTSFIRIDLHTALSTGNQSLSDKIEPTGAPLSNDDVAPRNTVDGQESALAHCRIAGQWYQRIGVVMFLGAMAVWFTSGELVRPVATPAERWTDYLSGTHAWRGWFSVVVFSTCVGGLGLVGAGMGLSNDRRSAGRLGLATTGFLGVIYLCSTVGFATTGHVWAAIPVAVVTMLDGFLFLTAAHCAALLKRFPPPKENPLTEEFLEEYRRKRDERRKKYDV